MGFIRLKINPDDHAKVLRLAALTGASTEAVFCAAVRWFLWVDKHCSSPQTGLDVVSVDAICKLSGKRPRVPLSKAMQDKDVRWIEVGGDGRVLVVDFLASFENCEKIRLERAEVERAKETARKREWRARNATGQGPDVPPPVPPKPTGQIADGATTVRARGDVEERRGEERTEDRTPVQSQPEQRSSPRSGGGLSISGDWTGTPDAIAPIGECPSDALAEAWAGRADVASDENAAAVLHALRAMRIGYPVAEWIVLAKRYTVPQLAAERAAVLADRGVEAPLPCLIGRLMKACGLRGKAAQLAALPAADRAWIGEVQRIIDGRRGGRGDWRLVR